MVYEKIWGDEESCGFPEIGNKHSVCQGAISLYILKFFLYRRYTLFWSGIKMRKFF